jgi:predicted nucleic acid-binding protein
MKVAVDTNILLSVTGARSSSESVDYITCSDAVDLMLERGFDPCVSFQNLVEFYAVATRSDSSNGYNLSVDQAIDWIETILQTYTLLPDSGRALDIWKDLCRKYQAKGKHVHDVRLAANALANGVGYYLTSDPAGYKFSEVKVLTPTAILRDKKPE